MSFFWISVELVSSIRPFDPGAFVADNPTSLGQPWRQRFRAGSLMRIAPLPRFATMIAINAHAKVFCERRCRHVIVE
jgi:hypothetical protein